MGHLSTLKPAPNSQARDEMRLLEILILGHELVSSPSSAVPLLLGDCVDLPALRLRMGPGSSAASPDIGRNCVIGNFKPLDLEMIAYDKRRGRDVRGQSSGQATVEHFEAPTKPLPPPRLAIAQANEVPMITEAKRGRAPSSDRKEA